MTKQNTFQPRVVLGSELLADPELRKSIVERLKERKLHHGNLRAPGNKGPLVKALETSIAKMANQDGYLDRLNSPEFNFLRQGTI